MLDFNKTFNIINVTSKYIRNKGHLKSFFLLEFQNTRNKGEKIFSISNIWLSKVEKARMSKNLVRKMLLRSKTTSYEP